MEPRKKKTWFSWKKFLIQFVIMFVVLFGSNFLFRFEKEELFTVEKLVKYSLLSIIVSLATIYSHWRQDRSAEE